jgi:hypothetical protein
VYVLEESLQPYFPFTWQQNPYWGSHEEALRSTLTCVMCWMVFARWLYLKKIFINM